MTPHVLAPVQGAAVGGDAGSQVVRQAIVVRGKVLAVAPRRDRLNDSRAGQADGSQDGREGWCVDGRLAGPRGRGEGMKQVWERLGSIAARVASHALTRGRRPRPPAEQPTDLPFIFIIGFNKTATTSLHAFFTGNGFPSVHWDRGKLARRMVQNCLDDRPILNGYDREFRVFSDMQAQSGRIRIEANQYFRILDRDYPGSYFILNTRDLGKWISSRSANFVTPHGATNLELEMRRLNTLDSQEAVELWARERNAFEADVRRYFRHNPRFLEIDITDPDLPSRVSRLIGMTMDATHWKHIRTN
jgi:hypothetical protein